MAITTISIRIRHALHVSILDVLSIRKVKVLTKFVDIT